MTRHWQIQTDLSSADKNKSLSQSPYERNTL